MLKTQKLDYIRNKSVQIIIVTWKICNLSLQIQGKFTNINSTFFCPTIFSFAFVSTLGKRNRELCKRRKCQAEESLQFYGIKWFLMLQKISIFRNIIYNLFILSVINLDYQNSLLKLKPTSNQEELKEFKKDIFKIIKIFLFILKSKLLSKVVFWSYI